MGRTHSRSERTLRIKYHRRIEVKRIIWIALLAVVSVEAVALEQTIGSADEKWQRVQSDGREIYVKTNGFYYTTNPPLSTVEHHSGYGFHTYIITNLSESTIIGTPQSVMNDVEGNCETRHYSVLGSLFFAGKNRSGPAMQNLPAENAERTLVPNSPLEKAFDMLCKIAREQK